MTYFFPRDTHNLTVGADVTIANFSKTKKHVVGGTWFQSSIPTDTLTEVDRLHIEEALRMAKVKYGKAFEKLTEE